MMQIKQDQYVRGLFYDTHCDPASRPPPAPALVQDPLHSGADRDRTRGARRLFLSRSRQGPEAARRRFHRADQDDDRAGDLLHRGARHLLDGRPQARRSGRAEVADLFRDGLDRGARGRPAGRRGAPARARLQHRSRHDRPEIGGDLRHQGQGRRHRRPSDGDHPRQLSGRPSHAAICCRCY
ncbi:hypothetical protein ACVWZL_006159 [Bradyrhizobium sp. GM2.4]